MKEPLSEGPSQGPLPDGVKLRKLTVNLGNTYVRLTAAGRRKVMRALEQFTFANNDSAAERDLWSKEEMKTCYLQLTPISQKMANDLRRWASEHLKVGHNNRLALKCLMDELVVRTWIEEP